MTRYLNESGVDFRVDIQVESWYSNPAIGEEFQRRQELLQRSIAEALGIPRKMIERAPVDTGFARLQWQQECAHVLEPVNCRCVVAKREIVAGQMVTAEDVEL